MLSVVSGTHCGRCPSQTRGDYSTDLCILTLSSYAVGERVKGKALAEMQVWAEMTLAPPFCRETAVSPGKEGSCTQGPECALTVSRVPARPGTLCSGPGRPWAPTHFCLNAVLRN